MRCSFSTGGGCWIRWDSASGWRGAARKERPTAAWPVEEGVAVDVDRSGDLVLRRDDGSTVTLNAGEVTVVSGAGIR